MKKKFNNTILIFLLIIFVIIFKYNSIVKTSILNSCILWFKTLVPSMFIMYLITDLLLNYGLSNLFYKVFKNNMAILFIISMFLGTPANAKYIRDFYINGHISKSEAEYLLYFSYSPNPLFILSVLPNTRLALVTLSFIYISNLLLAIVFRKKQIKKDVFSKNFQQKSFIKCLEDSINKSFKVLILVLGIIIIFGLINSFINKFLPNQGFIIKSLLEMTNAINDIVSGVPTNYKWILFTTSFGGLSIHTQIKSILEDTSISYKYFFYGRLIATLLALIVVLFY